MKTKQNEHAVLVRVNDRTQRVVTKIRAKLSKEQAETISNELNSTFASQGLNWFADIRTLDD
jgi:hypothetical protein